MSEFLDAALSDISLTRQPQAQPQQLVADELVGTFTDVQTETLNGAAIGSLAYKSAAAADADDPINPGAAVGAAPAVYDQPYVTSLATAINTLITAVAAQAVEVHDLKQKLRTAGIVTP